MSNELNLTKEEVMTDKLGLSGSEDKSAVNENKIVPITNVVADSAASNSVVSAAAANDPAAVSNDSFTADSATAVNNPVVADMVTAANPSIVAVAPVTTSDDSATTTDNAAATGFTDAAATTDSSAATGFTNAAATADYTDVPDSTASVSDASAANDTAKEKTTSYRQPKRRAESPKYYDEEPDEEFHFADEERPKKSFFRFRSVDEEESRDKLILSRIKDEDLMEYLALEQRRLEFLQQAKETKQKRLLAAFQLLISLAAIVAVTYLLQDNPTILISILYIVGIVAALNIWRNPHDKGKWRK